jgi:hypothetical protein
MLSAGTHAHDGERVLGRMVAASIESLFTYPPDFSQIIHTSSIVNPDNAAYDTFSFEKVLICVIIPT